VVHAFLLHGHERRVDDDAQRDEEVDERVHDEQLDEVRELVPAAAALPAEQQLVTLALQKLLLVHALLEPEKICDGNETTAKLRRRTLTMVTATTIWRLKLYYYYYYIRLI